MSFFARPDLSNEQFKQLINSTLTLSGQTQIASTSGLTLANGSGNTIIITARNPVVGNIMTFDGTEIRLMSPNPSGSTGNSGNYFGNSPTTCTVGGLSGGTAIYGCSISCILEEILVPVVPPTIIPPSHSAFIISPSTSLYEVGTSISICVTSCFNRGCITPQYCGTCCFRSGLPSAYNYTDFGVSQAPISCTACCNCHAVSAHTITNGNNIVSGSISYSSGATPAFRSNGSTYCTALPSGTTSPALSCIICGLYPYFYGTVASSGHSAGVCRPTPTCALVIAGTKVVSDSSSIIYINFNSTSDDYIWFAIPSGSTKTCWCVNALNNGAIGGAVNAGGNLFPTKASVNPVTTACWSGQTYNVYVSNYQSAVSTIMQIN